MSNKTRLFCERCPAKLTVEVRDTKKALFLARSIGWYSDSDSPEIRLLGRQSTELCADCARKARNFGIPRV